VYESQCIDAPVETVWKLIRSLKWVFMEKTINNCSLEVGKADAEVGSIRKVEYNDGTVQRIRVLGMSDIEHSVTYDLIQSDPPITYTAVEHTIKLHRITVGNRTFVCFLSNFSRDANQEALADSHYKKVEFLQALNTYIHQKCGEGKEQEVDQQQQAQRSRSSSEECSVRVQGKHKAEEMGHDQQHATEDARELHEFIDHLDMSEFERVSQKMIEDAWKHFDVNKDNVLEPKEIQKIIYHLIERIAREQNDLVHAMNKLFIEPDKRKRTLPSVLKTDFTKELMKTLEKKMQPLTSEFLGRLDKNKDGKIEHDEFNVLFSNWFPKKFTDLMKTVYR